MSLIHRNLIAPRGPRRRCRDPGPQARAIGQSVVVGDLRSHNSKVWKAKVAHVTHAGWEPSAAAWAVWELQA